LELLCAWLIIENNRYQGAQFFNSSNGFVASVNNLSQNVREYFSLREINTTLAAENAALRNKLEQKSQGGAMSGVISDSSFIKRFDFISAKVVNNSVAASKNYLTINRGTEDGVGHNMAVISPLGAVGKVKVASNHYAVVMSMLNIDMMISATIKRTGHFGTVQWNGTNPDVVNLKYIPPHVKPVKGDTIVTSGYNAIFPEGIMIGIIEDARLSDAALFYDIDVRLGQDFRKLSFVTVVRSEMKHEQDSLEQAVDPIKK
jgi:rod shape-determining protein MreC